MRVTITPLTLLASTYIAANARQSDIDELAAASPTLTMEQFGFIAPFTGEHAYCASLDGNPVFMFGVSSLDTSPHLGSAWGFGTNDTPKVMLAITKFVRRSLMPALLRAGVRRVEVRVLDSHSTSVSWLTKRLRAKLETPLPHMGANGETFLLLSWTKDRY